MPQSTQIKQTVLLCVLIIHRKLNLIPFSIVELESTELSLQFTYVHQILTNSMRLTDWLRNIDPFFVLFVPYIYWSQLYQSRKCLKNSSIVQCYTRKTNKPKIFKIASIFNYIKFHESLHLSKTNRRIKIVEPGQKQLPQHL